MKAAYPPSRINVVAAIFNLLDPIPFGFFVAALIFDVIYANTAVVLWVKSASWLVALGLVFAIVPQLINLALVWFRKNPARPRGQLVNFWLNVVAIVAALFNAFVHSRDAYAVIPEGVWLSAVTVLAMAIGRIVVSSEPIIYKETPHERA